MEKIGFIGLGKMGLPMAKVLLNEKLIVYGLDKNEEAIQSFINAGGIDSNLSNMIKNVKTIILMLPNSKIVNQVISEILSITSGMNKKPLTIIDMSSSYPMDTKNNYIRLKEANIELLDAPVSGGVKKAITGELTIMVGGEEKHFEANDNVFNALGRNVFLIGPTGSGHLIKSLNNYLSAVHMLSSCEVANLLSQFDLDLTKCIDVINQSTGRSLSTEYKFPNFILPGTFNSGFSMELMAKDLNIAKQIFKETENQSILVEKIALAYQNAFEELGNESDHTEMFTFVKQYLKQKGEKQNVQN